jgi:hypothetical protein
VTGDRSRYGLLLSAFGAIALAVSVFLPWYGVRVTVHAGLGAISARQFTIVSAQQVLGGLNLVLLALAVLAVLDALLPLARTGAPVPAGAGGSVVLLGAVASVLVLYRIIDPPIVAVNAGALSLRAGPWLALLASLAMMLGGVWPRRVHPEAPSQAPAPEAWPGGVSSRTSEG